MVFSRMRESCFTFIFFVSFHFSFSFSLFRNRTYFAEPPFCWRERKKCRDLLITLHACTESESFYRIQAIIILHCVTLTRFGILIMNY